MAIFRIGVQIDVLRQNLMTKDEARRIAAGIAKLPEPLKRPQHAGSK